MWVAVNHLQDGGTKTGLMRTRAAATIVAILWFSAAFTAQEAPTRDATAPAFDVVSIRALASSARGRTPGAQHSHGRFARGSATVRQLIQERPVYRMVMARRDGRLGPSIYSVEDAGCGGSAPQPCDLVPWSGGLTSLGMELQQLAAALFNRSQTTGIDRPVVDHTVRNRHRTDARRLCSPWAQHPWLCPWMTDAGWRCLDSSRRFQSSA